MAPSKRSFAVLSRSILALSITVQFCVPQLYAPAFADQGQIINLNNEGVKALNASNFQAAISAFEGALKLDPTYKLARQNLAIAHNNYGLQLRNNPKEALKQFHKALYLDLTNTTTMANVEGIIKMMGKNPKSFADRVELGDQARASADFIGAIIEYSAALQLKDDPKLHIKLGDVYRVRGDDDKAITEYTAAARTADSAEVELKLGQAYQSKKDIPNAISAYGRAIGFKSDDPDVLDGLVAGWEEALKENPLAPENHIGLGQAFQYRGDFGQAEEEFKQALRFSPGHRNPTAERLLSALPAAKAAAMVTKHINAGVDFQSRKDYVHAQQEYDEALKSDPNNAGVWVNKGTAYQAAEDFNNALKCYQQALKLDPSNQAAQQGIKTASAQQQDKMVGDAWKQGGDLFKQGKYDEAAAMYRKVLSVTPNDAATHYSLGAVLQAMKKYDEAVAEYRMAIGIDPKNKQYAGALEDCYSVMAKPIIAMAVEKHKAKDYPNAIMLYQKALEFTPKDPTLYFNIGAAQYSMQNYSASAISYQKALDLDPKGQVDDLYLLGTIDENFGKGLDAKSKYQKYLSQAPTGRYVPAAKDRLSALTKDITATEKIKSEAELAALANADNAYQQGVKLQQAGKFDEAIAQYMQAIQVQPRNADFVYALGTVYQQKKDWDNAIKQYMQASQLEPKNADFKKALDLAYDEAGAPIVDAGVAKQQGGDPAGAITLYMQALNYLPKNARLWTDLGTAYQQTDQFQKAREAYQKGYDLDNKNEVGNLYLMAAIDENFNQGSKALSEYQQYTRTAGKGGQYAALASGRIADLQKNPGNVQKLLTQADNKALAAAGAAYDEGVKLQQAGKLDEALAKYDEAIQVQPKEGAYWFAKGTVFQAQNKNDEAVKAYQKAAELQPQVKQYKDAIAALNQGQAALLLDEAVKKQTAGDVNGAIPLYEKALQITPNSARGWTNLGSAYQQAENFNKARECYEKALQIDGKGEADNWYYIAVLDENASQAQRAMQDYQRYIQTAGAKASYAAQAQARISALRANPSAVTKITTQAETAKNTEAQAAYDAAVKAQQDNKLDDAIASYQKAIGISPDAAYYYGLGTAYQAKNDLDKALENYKLAMAKNPKEPAYKAVIKQVNQLKAAPLTNSAIEKQTQKNDLPGAIADYRASLAIDDDAPTRMNYGTALQAANKPQEAVVEYKRSLLTDPKACAEAMYYLGTAYEQLNKPLDAYREYEEYVRKNPTGPSINAVKERIKILGPTLRSAGGRK